MPRPQPCQQITCEARHPHLLVQGMNLDNVRHDSTSSQSCSDSLEPFVRPVDAIKIEVSEQCLAIDHNILCDNDPSEP